MSGLVIMQDIHNGFMVIIHERFGKEFLMHFEINFKNFCFIILSLCVGLCLLISMPWFAAQIQQPKISPGQYFTNNPHYHHTKQKSSGFLDEVCINNLGDCPLISEKDSPIIFTAEGIIITTIPQAGPPYIVLGDFNNWLGGPEAQKDGSWRDYCSYGGDCRMFLTSVTEEGYPFIPSESWLFKVLLVPDELWMVASLHVEDNVFSWDGYKLDSAINYWANVGILGSCVPMTYATSFGSFAFLINPADVYRKEICW